MIILKSGKLVDAHEIILNNGFVDITPEENLETSKIFEKDGKQYKFNGWHKLVNRHWKDIEMTEV